MKPFKVLVEYQQTDYVKSLQADIHRMEAERDRLERLLHETQSKYGYETMLNNELIDIMRNHGIDYRKGLDSGKRMS